MLFFIKTLKKRKMAAIRNRMRGYRILKETGQLDLLIRIKDDITNTPLKRVNKKSSRIFFGAGISNAEKVLKQFLILRFVNWDFNKTLLIAIGKGHKKLTVPLPYEWRIVLEKYGFQTNTFWNKIIWLSHLLFLYAYGVFIGLQSLLVFVGKRKDLRNIQNSSSTVYFHSLTSNNLPQKQKDGNSYDIISWYSKWKNRLKHVEVYCHSVKNVSESELNGVAVMYVSSSITALKGFLQIFKYFLSLIWMPFFALFDLLRGRYWHALILSESFRSFHFRLLQPEQISRDYLFHNSQHLFRPVWTYDAEDRGARVLFYFYSTNIERFKDLNGYSIQPFSWQIITWSNILVWDEYQADFIRRIARNNINIEIVGTIDFHDSNKEFEQLPEHSILVFDVQPYRETQYQMLAASHEYFVPEVVNKFLEDIYEVSKSFNLVMVLKRKRHIGNMLNKKYKLLLDRLENSDNFISIDPDIAALRLIREAEIVISMPFTATALIARSEGKLSIFYDPSGLVQKGDRAAHGIEIIIGKSELREWMQKHVKQQLNVSS
jgi:polysaccharide biosynthesis PFTS motif protein